MSKDITTILLSYAGTDLEVSSLTFALVAALKNRAFPIEIIVSNSLSDKSREMHEHYLEEAMRDNENPNVVLNADGNLKNPAEQAGILIIDRPRFSVEAQNMLIDCYEELFLEDISEDINTIILSCDGPDWDLGALIIGLAKVLNKRASPIELIVSNALTGELQSEFTECLRKLSLNPKVVITKEPRNAEALKDICIKYVAKNFITFKANLEILPQELQVEINNHPCRK